MTGKPAEPYLQDIVEAIAHLRLRMCEANSRLPDDLKARSDIDRRAALDALARQSQELGLYGFIE